MAKDTTRYSSRTPSSRIPAATTAKLQCLRHNHGCNSKELLEKSCKRYAELVKHGYALMPNSGSSWEVPMGPKDCERHISSNFQELGVIVARRLVDNTLVVIKRVDRDTIRREGVIVKRLARSRETDVVNDPAFLTGALSGSWPVMRMPSFEDPLDRGWYMWVKQPEFWQPIERLQLWNLGEVVDFISQTSEGLAFMHRNGVTHGGICTCTTGSMVFEDPNWQQAGTQRARHVRDSTAARRWRFISTEKSHLFPMGALPNANEQSKWSSRLQYILDDIAALGMVYRKTLYDSQVEDLGDDDDSDADADTSSEGTDEDASGSLSWEYPALRLPFLDELFRDMQERRMQTSERSACDALAIATVDHEAEQSAAYAGPSHSQIELTGDVDPATVEWLLYRISHVVERNYIRIE